VLAFWKRLDAEQQGALLKQLGELDFDALGRIRALLATLGTPVEAVGTGDISPAPVVELAGAEEAAARTVGTEALRRGQVGVILVAGGQGTRLGYDGPKGTYALAPLSGASLFEIHARKILALQRRYGAAVPFYIMTSQANDADTRRFLAAHGHFGLDPAHVQCFPQGMLPAFWPDGRVVLEAPGRLFTAPDGHGGVLAALARTGMLADMRRRGLTTLFYFQVDNPMVDIAAPAFIGLHLRRGAEMSIKVCAKRDPSEGLGVAVERGGRHTVVEYTELTEAQKQARRPDGELLFKYGSVAIHVFSLAFLERETSAGLPLHQAHKKVPYCDATGVTVKPAAANAYKFEKFIFDALPDAAQPLVLAFAREDEFAPVKNAEGSDSPATARAAMMEKAARWLAACGVTVPRDAAGRLAVKVEIDPAYAHDADELRARLPKGWAIAGDVWLK
jgi:UDP-N-acetylglucosamine/UDP-N-acetylgalactosamine diphosphorylase